MGVTDLSSERFERLFAVRYRTVAAYLIRRCATVEDAEDAAVEVFATVWRRIADVPREPDDLPWLYGVARRVLANQTRSRRRRERLLARLTDAASRLGRGFIEAPTSETGGILEALHRLPERDRELLMLIGWEDLSVSEAARVLRLPGPLVSRRLYRARQRFRIELANQGRHDERATETSQPITNPSPQETT